MRVYLIGYMGSGKSTVAKKLAKVLKFISYDLDHLFQEKYKIDIGGFFSKYDETLFRKLESQLLKETTAFECAIIATGGGTPCFYDNMNWMNRNGITVYLQMSPASIVSRLSLSKKKRPLIASKSSDELLGFVTNHLRQRNIFYSQAQIIVSGESVDHELLAHKVFKEIENRT